MHQGQPVANAAEGRIREPDRARQAAACVRAAVGLADAGGSARLTQGRRQDQLADVVVETLGEVLFSCAMEGIRGQRRQDGALVAELAAQRPPAASTPPISGIWMSMRTRS